MRIFLLCHPALVAVEIPHPGLAARLQHIGDLAELPAANRALGGGARQQDFAYRNPQPKFRQKFQALANDTDHAIGELRSDAALDLRRE